MDVVKIREEVNRLFEEVPREVFAGWRCHECARYLGKSLLGYDVKVCDGYITYQSDFFWKKKDPDCKFAKEHPEMYELMFGKPPTHKLRVQHSWCVIGGEIIVDYHPTVRLGHDAHGMERFVEHCLRVYHINQAKELGVLTIESVGKEFKLKNLTFVYFGGIGLLDVVFFPLKCHPVRVIGQIS